jgi:L-asparagine transporter-like permease
VRAGRTVALRIMFFYVGSIAIIQAIIPWDQVVPGQSPFVAALGLIHVPGASAIIGAVIFTAIVSCLNSAIYVTSRMLYEMAQRGDAPAVFTKTSSTKVPAIGIVVSGVLGFGVVMTSVMSENGLFAFLVQSSGATIMCVYLLIAFAQIALRQRLERNGEKLDVKVWLFPAVSYACVVSILAVLVMMLFSADERLEVILSVGVFAACVIAYHIRARLGSPVIPITAV